MRFWLLTLFLLFTTPVFAQYKVVLTWQPPTCMTENNCTDPVATYSAYRAPSGSGSYTQIASDISQLTYTDLNVNYSTSYDYYVVSVDSSGVQSAPSNIATVSIPSILLNPVTGVTILISMSDGREILHLDKMCTEYDTVFNLL